jgi:hypothetical protein
MTNGQPTIAGGEAVTAVNVAGGEIDARAWRWDVDDAGAARTVVVQVTGQAESEQPMRPEVAAALETRGRSVVEEVVAAQAPLPRRVTLMQAGQREVLP